MRKDVVLRFDLSHPPFRHPARPDLVVEAIETEEMLVHAPRGVGHGSTGPHDESPVAALHQHELAGSLVEGALEEPVRGRVPARQLDHTLPGHVEMAIDPCIALVQPIAVVALPTPGG